MVVPGLRCHLYRNEQCYYCNDSSDKGAVEFQSLLEVVNDSSNTHTTPDSEGVERTGVSIVALTRLHRRLVKIYNDSETRHEEQEEYYPELSYAALTAICLPEKTQQTEYQRQTVEDVMSLIVLQVVGKQVLTAKTCVVDERESCNPVAVL